MWPRKGPEQVAGAGSDYFSFLLRCSFLAYAHLKTSLRSVLLNSVGIGIGVAMLISLGALTESSQQSLITTLRYANLDVIQVSLFVDNEHTPLTTGQLNKMADSSLLVTGVQMGRLTEVSYHEHGRHGKVSLLALPQRLLGHVAVTGTTSRITPECVLYGAATRPDSKPHAISLNGVPCLATTIRLPPGIRQLAPVGLDYYWVIADRQLPYALEQAKWRTLYSIAFDSLDLDELDNVRRRIDDKVTEIYPGADVKVSWAGESILSTRDYIRQVQLVGLALSLVVFLVTGVAMSNTMFAILKMRTKEFGIRVACGAGPADIATQCLLEAVGISLAGALSGSVLAAFVLIAVHLSSGISIYLPLSYLAATYAIALIFSLAVSVPSAIRSSRLDPATAIRQL